MLSPVCAQNQVKDTNTGKVHVIDELTVSTTGRNRNVLSTASTQLVTQKQLFSQGVTDLSDALRRFSGVNVRDYGGAGGVKTIKQYAIVKNYPLPSRSFEFTVSLTL